MYICTPRARCAYMAARIWYAVWYVSVRGSYQCAHDIWQIVSVGEAFRRTVPPQIPPNLEPSVVVSIGADDFGDRIKPRTFSDVVSEQRRILVFVSNARGIWGFRIKRGADLADRIRPWNISKLSYQTAFNPDVADAFVFAPSEAPSDTIPRGQLQRADDRALRAPRLQ
jgi:hypothetical protein